MGGVVYLLETKINQLRLFAVIHNNSANYGIIPVMIQTDFCLRKALKLIEPFVIYQQCYGTQLLHRNEEMIDFVSSFVVEQTLDRRF
jgi:hypothetical protein